MDMRTPALLENYVAGQWVAGSGERTALTDPVTGDTLAFVSSAGLDLDAAFSYARDTAGPALRALSYGERAARLSQIVATLQANRDDYYAIATANAGTVATDSAVDIDGAIYTLSTFAKLGATLGDAHTLLDGAAVPLAKDASFAVRHVFRPTPGVALSRRLFEAPTQHYKCGVVFLAWLNGFQTHFRMVGGAESARGILHYADLFRLADRAALFVDPELAARRMAQLCALNGVA